MDIEKKQKPRRSWRWMAILLMLPLPIATPVATMAEAYNQLNILPDNRQSIRDLQLPDLTGEVRNLYDHRDKVVLLTFFATWCPQCIAELPQLVHVQEQYQSRGFTVVAVSIDQDAREKVQQWVTEQQLNYPVLHDQTYSVRKSHGVSLIPTIYVLGKNMKLAAKVIGEINWQSEEASQLIDSLLAERSDNQYGAESSDL
jgi:peroxiredoxin